MCVLAIAWRAHPRWQFVVAANRDEFHDRAAAPLHRWDGLIAGRDLVAGGTWLAVTERGRFAAVTNLRGFGGPDPTLASRGALVAGLARGDAEPALAGYNPFNALVVAGREAYFLSNRPAAVRTPLASGFHAMSNGPLDPPWRKTVRLAAAVEGWLADDRHDPEALFAGARDATPPTGDATDPAPIFVDDRVYGTRCTTLVTVDADGAGTIIERRFDRGGAAVGDTAIAFRWP